MGLKTEFFKVRVIFLSSTFSVWNIPVQTNLQIQFKFNLTLIISLK